MIQKTCFRIWPALFTAFVLGSTDNGEQNRKRKRLSRNWRLQMQLVERHLVKKDHPHFARIDAAAFASKNLYNQATFQIRQAFIHEGKYLPYTEIFHRVKHLGPVTYHQKRFPREVQINVSLCYDHRSNIKI